MGNVIQFVTRPVNTNEAPATALPDHWKWQCGECASETFVIWGDGIVCCAECSRQAAGMTATVEATK